MSNEIVKYENQFNNVALRDFTSNQLDLLMAISSRMKEKNQDYMEFEFDYLKSLIKLEKNYTNEEFIKEITTVNKKLLSLNFMFETPKEIIQFALFSYFAINKDTLTLKVQVNPKFSFLLNDLSSNFTRFELEEFVNFKSSYTKEFYRRMKQFRTTGTWNVSIENFKRLLDIPNSYKMSDIDTRVLNPIKKELKEKYKLKITKKYEKLSSRGRPSVVGFEFKFKTDIYTSLKEKNEEILATQYLEYLYRTIRLFDKNFKRYNYLKIIHIQKLDNEKIIMTVINQDDNYKSQITLNNEQHLHNFVQKNLI